MALKFLNNGYFAGKVGIGTQTLGGKLDIAYTGTGGTGTFGIGEGLNISSFSPNITFNDSSSGVDNYSIHLNQNVFTLGRYTSATAQNPDLVLKSGNVGIGTDSPSYPLHVSSTLGYPVLVERTNSNDAGIRFKDQNTTDIDSVRIGAIGNDFRVFTNGSERMRIDSSGNVGIGTDDPADTLSYGRALDIQSSTGGAIYLRDSDATSVYGLFSYEGGTTNRTNIGGVGVDNYLRIISGGGEAMRINYSKDVMMGNTVVNPASNFSAQKGFGYKFSTGQTEIATTADVSALTLGRNLSADGSILELRKESTIIGLFGSNTTGGQPLLDISANTTNGNMRFLTAGSERMRIDSTGNVGIGTTSPSQKLHVDGNARVTGAYYDSNNSPGTANQVLVSTATGTDWIDGSAIPGVPAGSGTLNTVAMWTPDGDTLGNAPITVSGNDSTFAGDITVSGNQFFNGEFIEGDGKEMFRYTDGWLRINENNDFGSGIYCGTGLLRTDGEFQVGGSGQYAKITSTGAATFAGNVTLSSTLPLLYLTNTTASTGKNWRLSSATNGKFFIAQEGVVDAITLDHTSGNATFAGAANINGLLDVNTGAANTVAIFESTSDKAFIRIKDDDTDTYLISRNNAFSIGDSSADYNNFKVNITNGNTEIAGSLKATQLELQSAVPSILFNETDVTANWRNRVQTGGYRVQYASDGSTFSDYFVLGASANTVEKDTTFTEQAFSAATSSGDASSTLTTKGYVDGLITGATIYRGTWDPDVSLNSGYGNPNLNTVTQTSGYYYICSADGAATPNGATTEPNTWNTGDWVIWNDDIGTSGEWQKIDNSSVLSGAGTGQTVALWEGTSSVTDSETLGNAPITVSGSNVLVSAGLQILRTSDPFIQFYEGSTNVGDVFADTSLNNIVLRGASGHGVRIMSNGEADNSEAGITLDTSSNVGIGTTSPGADLHVNSVNTAGTVIVGRTGTNINASTSIGTITFPADYNASPANYAQVRAYSNALSSLRGSLDFNVKSTSGNILTGLTVYGTNSGVNVGIGTTSPTTRLNTMVAANTDQMVLGTASGGFKVGNTTGNEYGINMGVSNSGASWIQVGRTDGTATAYDLSLQASGGNVGIGTISPAFKLTVDGIGSEGAIGIERDTVSASTIIGALNFTNNNGATIYGRVRGGRNSNGDGYASLGTGLGDNLYAIEGGNVGIGTTTPGSKLQVYSAASTNVFITGYGTSAQNDWGAQNAMFVKTDNGLVISKQNAQNNTNRLYTFYNDASGNAEQYIHNTSNTATIKLDSAGDSYFNGGNVGIGTTTNISSPLTIQTDSSAGALSIIGRNNGTNDEAVISFYEYDGTTRNAYIIKEAGNLAFATGTGGSASERMRVFSNGNVNIGVAETGSSAVTGPFVVTHSSSRFLTSSFEEGTVSLSAKNNNNNLESLRIAGDSIKFFNGTNAVGSQKMVILSSGNVGIGVTGPQSKLQVDGGIQMADDTATASATKVGTMRYRTDTEYVEVTGTELVTNGDFANGQTSWTVSGADATHIATFNGDTLRYQSSTTSPQLIVAQASVLEVGKIYKITIDIETLTSGSLKVDSLGGLNITPSVGVSTFYATATGTTFNITRATTNVDITIDDVSVAEVTAEDASYADMCMQTGASTYEWVNIVRNTY